LANPNLVAGPGRPLGSINRSTRDLYARAWMDSVGFNPLKKLKERFEDTSLPEDIRQSCLINLADRYAPRLKAVDVNIQDQSSSLPSVVINIVSADPTIGKIIEAQTIQQQVIEHVLDNEEDDVAK